MQHPSGLQAKLVDGSGNPLPAIEHNGQVYVVSTPGQVFQVQVTRSNSSSYGSSLQYMPYIQVTLIVDGQNVGFRKIITPGRDVTFEGFLESISQHGGGDVYRQFKFAAANCGGAGVLAQEGAPRARVVEHPDQLTTGRIQLKAVNCQPSSRPCVPCAPAPAPAAETTALPGKKKFFMQPSLTTERGAAKVLPSNWASYDVVGGVLWQHELRYETADTLVLRQILRSDNPAHHPLLATCTIPSVVDALRGGLPEEDIPPPPRRREQQRQLASAPEASLARTVAGPSSRRVEAGAKAAGAQSQVKTERQPRVKRERGTAGTPCGAAVDLTGEARPLMLPGGRTVARDEVAVCDLADSDDEAQPRWQVQKKQRAGAA